MQKLEVDDTNGAITFTINHEVPLLRRQYNVWTVSGYKVGFVGFTFANTLPTNTVENHVGVFGTNSTIAGKVGVNSSSKWYQENISIRFN